jgi:hypothetical protein
MSTSDPLFVINRPFDDVLTWTTRQLSQSGLRLLQTFDLSTARPAPADCPCPQHGTKKCDCQMVILLVYGAKTEPVTLILHGNDGKTWFSLVSNSSQEVDVSTRSSIEQALQLK